MDKKNIIFNNTLEQYNKKYKNLNYRLLKVTKKEVEDFDKKHNTKSGYLLEGRKWWFIKDTYYEVPRPIRFTWFRNLNAGIQIATCLLGVGAVATAITIPILSSLNHKSEAKDVLVEAVSITTSETSVDANEKLELKASILPENASNKSLNWEVDNVAGSGEIVYENNKVYLKGLTYGYVDVIATAKDSSGKFDKKRFIVNPPVTDLPVYLQVDSEDVGAGNISIKRNGVETMATLDIQGYYKINGIKKKVVKIANQAFSNFHTLSALTLPSTLETIGDKAFEFCSALGSVTIPTSVTKIGYSAFGSSSLNSVTFADNDCTWNVQGTKGFGGIDPNPLFKPSDNPDDALKYLTFDNDMLTGTYCWTKNN